MLFLCETEAKHLIELTCTSWTIQSMQKQRNYEHLKTLTTWTAMQYNNTIMYIATILLCHLKYTMKWQKLPISVHIA